MKSTEKDIKYEPLTLDAIEELRLIIFEQTISARDSLNETLETLRNLQTRILKLKTREIVEREYREENI